MLTEQRGRFESFRRVEGQRAALLHAPRPSRIKEAAKEILCETAAKRARVAGVIDAIAKARRKPNLQAAINFE